MTAADPPPPAPPAASVLGRIWSSNVTLCVALAGALALLLGVVNWHYPIHTWLAWRYLGVGALALLWSVCCLSGGYWLLQRLRVQVQSEGLRAALAFPLGVAAFQGAVFILGLAHLLGVVTFVLLPVAFSLAGRRHLLGAARTLRRELAPPQTFPRLAVWLFGFAGLGLLYFQILSPEAIHWDARWYHLPLAQNYALQGSVAPSPERWWLAGYPHSTSLLYTWAFSIPGALLFDRLELCLHMEMAVFLATIASIPVLVRALAPTASGIGAWAAVFLFPGILLYDSNLAGAADHVAALWCIPLALTLLQLWRRWTVSDAALFGVFAGAAMATKYSAWSMVVFPGLLFGIRAIWLLIARLKTKTDRGPRAVALLAPLGVGIAALLLVSSQHWLRNWVWYGDPLYPTLQRVFHEQPWSPEASASQRLLESFGSPAPLTKTTLIHALGAAFTFAFIPNDWAAFHRNVPVFGFLFTLSMFCLPFIRATARLWLAYAGVLVAVACWYVALNQDRYLQAWLPVMVACTVATMSAVWRRRNRAVRALLAALVAFQIVWGGDIPFFPTHNLINDSSFRLVSSFLASGFMRTPDRLRLFGDEGRVAELLPPDANLLVHETNMHVGFGVHTVNDQWQARISYATLGSPAAIHRELASLGITHVTWEQKLSGWNSLGADLAFMGFALNYGAQPVTLGMFTLAKFPATSPPPTFNDRVAMLGCGNPYPNGWYRLGQMIIPAPGAPGPTPMAPLGGDVAATVREAGFMVVDPGCAPPLPADLAAQFRPPVSLVRGPLQLYVRRL